MANMETSVPLTNLPFYVNGGTSVQVGSKAFIFDEVYPNNTRMALELDLDTYDLQTVGPPTLPIFNVYPSSVYDGSYVYVVGGYLPNTGPTDGLIQFDPVTKENNFIPVRNFPVEEGTSYFYNAPASIFVSSRNRIYFFGGRSRNFTTGLYIIHDEIFYIDLTPLVEPTPSTTTPSSTSTTTMNPDLFTCSGRPDGIYPHPTDCSLFIGCENEELTIFSCPPPLLFDPVMLVCTLPEEVDCATTCVDRPDGTYPHPHDCSMYILCRSGASTVVKCPPPLLFDPEELHCDFNVTCPASS